MGCVNHADRACLEPDEELDFAYTHADIQESLESMRAALGPDHGHSCRHFSLLIASCMRGGELQQATRS